MDNEKPTPPSDVIERRERSSEDSFEEPEQPRRRPPTSAAELFGRDIPERALRANERLRGHLGGTLLISIVENGARYTLDWSGEKLVVRDLRAEETADCTMSLRESDLLAICSGSLNPQIGMLSEKIRVSGNVALAVYVFNLIAPRSNYAQ